MALQRLLGPGLGSYGIWFRINCWTRTYTRWACDIRLRQIVKERREPTAPTPVRRARTVANTGRRAAEG